MIISNNNQIQNQNNNKKHATFGNAAAINAAMNFFATNEAIGATAVDMGSMVIPRTAIDFTRTPEAGLETARRELVSCILYAVLGYFGLAAAVAMSPFVGAKKYNVPLKSITAGSDAVDTTAHSWNAALQAHGGDLANKKSEIVETYLHSVLGSVTGTDGEKKIKISKEDPQYKEIVKEMRDMILDEKEKSKFTIDGKKQESLVQKMIHAAGSSGGLQVKVPGREEVLEIGADNLLSNTYTMAKTFMSDKVAAEFKNAPDVKDNKFVKDIKKFNNKKMYIGLGVASAFAISMQAINRWMTKKKTGSDGFVAYKGEKAEKDKSFSFQAMKATAAAAMAGFSLKTIVGKDSWKSIPKKLEFTRLMPSLAQYKLLYGVTIMGRFLASGDKNELRESVTRDFLGFTSWLILGDFAARAIARQFEKHSKISLLNYKQGDLKGELSKIKNSSLKTHAEIVYAKGEKALGKSVYEASKIVSNDAKKALNYRSISQGGGYLVSGLLLGVGIPLLNKTITNKFHKKSESGAKEPQQAISAQTSQLSDTQKQKQLQQRHLEKKA